MATFKKPHKKNSYQIKKAPPHSILLNIPLDPYLCVKRLYEGKFSTGNNHFKEYIMAYRYLGGNREIMTRLAPIFEFDDLWTGLVDCAEGKDGNTHIKKRVPESKMIEFTKGELVAIAKALGRSYSEEKFRFCVSYIALFKSFGYKELTRDPNWSDIFRAAGLDSINYDSSWKLRVMACLSKAGIISSKEGKKSKKGSMSVRLNLHPDGEVVLVGRDIFDLFD